MNDEKIARLLNDKNGDIFTNDNLSVLINEYFGSPHARFVEEELDEDSDDEEFLVDEALPTASQELECDLEEEKRRIHEENEPVVCVHLADVDCEVVKPDFSDDKRKKRYVLPGEFSCRCQMRGVFAQDENDCRKGCIVQFTPTEISDVQLSCADMERCEYLYYFSKTAGLW